MFVLTHHDITTLFLALGIMLLIARLLGEIARVMHQPSVLGEILAGLVLGPTVLGTLYPEVTAWLFPTTGPVAAGIEAITTIGIALFLLVAGMEVNLSIVWRQGRPALLVGAMGMIIPFALGFAAGWLAPELLGKTPEASRPVFSLFLATALSISALPVVAKILLDLDLFRTDLGMIVVAAAIFNDLLGWMIFSVILGLMGGGTSHSLGLGFTIGVTVGFALFMLTAGRWLLDRSLPWIQAHLSWPGGVIGVILATTFFASALTEWIGIHAIFGAFLAGVAIGDSRHLREHTRVTLDHFISFIFAPLFFASIGLRVNFVQSFDMLLVAVIIAIATAGKVVGCGLGARWSGLSERESWAIGFGMNARGAMEIILGLLALNAGLIGERMFVALVLMALVTSMASGSLMQRILRTEKPPALTDYISGRRFIAALQGRTANEVIAELARAAAAGTTLDPEATAREIQAREELFSTALGNGVAVPHARVHGLKQPIIAVGLSREGVDFDAPDGRPARLIILILTPKEKTRIQLDILAHISRLFHDPHLVELALASTTYTHFRSVLISAAGERRNNGTPPPQPQADQTSPETAGRGKNSSG
ncbi:MAG: hypothetical protein Kow0059_01350 [Candidatus Sumerlaeia bacterium]